jgi:hypothetical protein
MEAKADQLVHEVSSNSRCKKQLFNLLFFGPAAELERFSVLCLWEKGVC